jgi:hypothetical protein
MAQFVSIKVMLQGLGRYACFKRLNVSHFEKKIQFMMNSTSPERVRQDCHLLRKTLFKLLLPRLLGWIGVMLVVGALWLYGAVWIFGFGATVDYGSLQFLSQATLDFLNRINVYLWSGVIILWSLILFFVARGWLRGRIGNARLMPLPVSTVTSLARNLGVAAIEVMRWCWASREEPFTIGDLQRTVWEIRRGRIVKIAIVRDQAAILDQAVLERSAPLVESDTLRATGHHAEEQGVLLRRDPHADRSAEPYIGST